jgi:hypothetical protein
MSQIEVRGSSYTTMGGGSATQPDAKRLRTNQPHSLAAGFAIFKKRVLAIQVSQLIRGSRMKLNASERIATAGPPGTEALKMVSSL